MNKTVNVILIGIVCFILTFAVSLQAKTIKNTELITNRTSVNADLRDNAIKWQEKYYEILADLEKADNNLKDVRNKSLQNNPDAIENIKNYLVHDANLREVVRILKNSGAEALSINGQRVIFSTAIICSGNVIRVNDEKVGSPFTIKAIGSPELLYGNLQNTIKNLNKLGITVKIEKSNNIDIEKFEGTIRNEYARSTE